MTESLKIAMVNDGWYPTIGGVVNHVKNLSNAMAANHDVTVDIHTRALVSEHIDRSGDEGLHKDVSVIRHPPATEFGNPIGRVATALTPIPSLLRTDYDIVHGHTYYPSVATMLSGKLSGSKSVLTVHGTALNSGTGVVNSPYKNKINRFFEKLFVLRFKYNGVISVNRNNVDLLQENHTSVKHIANGINTSQFLPKNTSEDTKHILFIGRLAQKKRVQDLLKAFDTVHQSTQDVKLIIAGSGPEEAKLKQLKIALDLGSKVEFTGRIPDEEVIQLYAKADVFVLPSVWEGHPITLLEAWGSGTPVVTTEVEGIQEYVTHRTNGYLVPSKSPEELADGILYALDHPDEAEEWVSAAKELVEGKYTWERIADETLEYYRSLLKA
jgi:glycosyltransferase involved in cell wall biosynthesis